jgi:predicted nucleic acid-binding protein
VNIVDSSAWLEYFASGVNASFFAEAIENPRELIVPSLSLYEVFKRVVQQRTENEALLAIAAMQQGQVVDLDAQIALRAARISIDQKLPLADSVMLATARSFEAILWTQDAHFEGMGGVRYKKFSRLA